MIYQIEIDGSEHDCPTSVTGCCKELGRPCKIEDCDGWMHFQGIWHGIIYQCEKCEKRGI